MKNFVVKYKKSLIILVPILLLAMILLILEFAGQDESQAPFVYSIF